MSITQLKPAEVEGNAPSGHALSVLKQAIVSKIIGQEELVETILVCLLADGHLLIEGMPGLAKTTAAKSLADAIEGDFHRVQFTPDLLPSDLIGTEVYVHEQSNFTFRKGPLFNNIVLADEINRAPAKVQSALLEAMEEKQITVGHDSYALPELYMVIATQNPIEQEGTYQLPEAQLDRFLMYVVVDYPSHEDELKILELDEANQNKSGTSETPHITQKELFEARHAIHKIHVADSLKKYMVSLVAASREPKAYDEKLSEWLIHGASPRATLALLKCSKALAWLRNDEFVTPEHIQTVCPHVLRHRIMPSFEAEAEGVSRTEIIKRLLEVVAVP